MKKIKITSLFIIIAILCASLVFATDVKSGEIIESDLAEESQVQETEKQEKNIIKFGETVNASGIANDLIILAGSDVSSNATGDYSFIAGSTIKMTDNIRQDAFLAGSDITIDGEIGRDVYAAAKTVTIKGNISGNIYVFCNQLYISSGAVIGGTVNANGSKKIAIADGAQIAGKVKYYDTASVIIPEGIETYVMESKIDEDFNRENPIISKTRSVIYWIIANTILFSFLLLVLPGMFEKIKKSYESKSGKVYLTSAGWGILLLIAIPIIALIALITIICSPLGFALFVIYTFVLLMTTVLVGYLLGTTLFNKTKMNKWLTGFLGITILEILCALPLIGGIVGTIKVLVGTGIIIEIIKREKPQQIAQTEETPTETNEKPEE